MWIKEFPALPPGPERNLRGTILWLRPSLLPTSLRVKPGRSWWCPRPGSSVPAGAAPRWTGTNFCSKIQTSGRRRTRNLSRSGTRGRTAPSSEEQKLRVDSLQQWVCVRVWEWLVCVCEVGEQVLLSGCHDALPRSAPPACPGWTGKCRKMNVKPPRTRSKEDRIWDDSAFKIK